MSKKRYLCPICDLELKGSRHFCVSCKSFFEKPIVYEGLHIPNESDCFGCMEDYRHPKHTREEMAKPVSHRESAATRVQRATSAADTSWSGRADVGGGARAGAGKWSLSLFEGLSELGSEMEQGDKNSAATKEPAAARGGYSLRTPERQEKADKAGVSSQGTVTGKEGDEKSQNEDSEITSLAIKVFFACVFLFSFFGSC